MRYQIDLGETWHSGRIVKVEADNPKHALELGMCHLVGDEAIQQIIEDKIEPESFGRRIVYDSFNGFLKKGE